MRRFFEYVGVDVKGRLQVSIAVYTNQLKQSIQGGQSTYTRSTSYTVNIIHGQHHRRSTS